MVNCSTEAESFLQVCRSGHHWTFVDQHLHLMYHGSLSDTTGVSHYVSITEAIPLNQARSKCLNLSYIEWFNVILNFLDWPRMLFLEHYSWTSANEHAFKSHSHTYNSMPVNTLINIDWQQLYNRSHWLKLLVTLQNYWVFFAS